MFEEVIRELERMGREGISVNISLDDEGYFDRRCPSDQCHSHFKIHIDDWADKFESDEMICPFCGGTGSCNDFYTEEQLEYALEVAPQQADEKITRALQLDAKRFNRVQPRDSLIKMSLHVGPVCEATILPDEAAAAIQQKITCEKCQCRIAVVGAAFFCPSCGHKWVQTTFDSAVETVRNTLGDLHCFRAYVEDKRGTDAAENTVRQILESSVDRLVSAFQALAEALFEALPGSDSHKPKKNVFQRISDASDLWRQATGKGYEDILESGELADLQRLIQQRHLLAHKNGIVDQEYIDRSGDSSYQPGQRLVIREEGVLLLADLVTKLAAGLRKLVMTCSTPITDAGSDD